MAAKLTKNYRLIRSLNASHGPATRALCGAVAFLATLLATSAPVLARRHWRDFASNDFKLALRRAQWLYARSWLQLRLIEDPFFDFTEGFTREELPALSRFLARRQNPAGHAWQLADEAFVLARRGHLELEANLQDAFAETLARYEAVMNEALRAPADTGRGNGRPVRAAASEDASGNFSQADGGLALEDLAHLLSLAQWPWYVISGTFLGLVREGGFLAHDVDIDVGIDAEAIDITALLQRLAASPAFVVRNDVQQLSIGTGDDGRFALRHAPALVKLVHRTGINVDVFIHHREGGVVWHGSSLHRWENTPFAMARYDLAGVAVQGPADADRYLTENYGDWRVPVKTFSATTGTPNLRLVSNLFSPALFLKRMLYHAGRGEAEGRKIEAQMLRSGCLKRQDTRVVFDPAFLKTRSRQPVE